MASNAWLPRLLDSRMKFTTYLAPNSLDLLNLRSKIKNHDCPHCHCRAAVLSHGYLRGYALSGDDKVTRGIAFFCSNRYSNIGCGRTFSIDWDTVIPYCSMRTSQLFELISEVAKGTTPHRAGLSETLRLSTRSARRWVKSPRSKTTSRSRSLVKTTWTGCLGCLFPTF